VLIVECDRNLEIYDDFSSDDQIWNKRSNELALEMNWKPLLLIGCQTALM